MNRYIAILTSSTSSRHVTVAANGIIDARIKADKMREHGERVTGAILYEASYTITCN